MSEFSPPSLSGDPAGNGQEALTPEAIEPVLADFRSWLEHAATVALPCPPAAPDLQPLDLHTLLAQFVAVRHEVTLQTRASRAQQEQQAATLEQLQHAVDLLEEARTESGQVNQQVVEDAVRPLLKTLVDAYDALARAEREVRRIRDEILACFTDTNALTARAQTDSEAQTPVRPVSSLWARWFRRGTTTATVIDSGQNGGRPVAASSALTERIRALLDSVVTGYTMSVQRIARALETAGLEAIGCVGQEFDPELMEVVAVASDSGRPAGAVIEEVRRGYRWRGRVFRYAQVSVAKP
jgi:molecular chaperone GrpE